MRTMYGVPASVVRPSARSAPVGARAASRASMMSLSCAAPITRESRASMKTKIFTSIVRRGTAPDDHA